MFSPGGRNNHPIGIKLGVLAGRTLEGTTLLYANGAESASLVHVSRAEGTTCFMSAGTSFLRRGSTGYNFFVWGQAPYFSTVAGGSWPPGVQALRPRAGGDPRGSPAGAPKGLSLGYPRRRGSALLAPRAPPGDRPGLGASASVAPEQRGTRARHGPFPLCGPHGEEEPEP